MYPKLAADAQMPARHACSSGGCSESLGQLRRSGLVFAIFDFDRFQILIFGLL
jgi:hypothetical protein